MYTMALTARAVADWFPGAEVVSLGCKFTNPVPVPADGGVEIEVAGEAKEPDEDGLTTVALTVTCGGQKVLGMPKAVLVSAECAGWPAPTTPRCGSAARPASGSRRPPRRS